MFGRVESEEGGLVMVCGRTWRKVKREKRKMGCVV